MRQLIFFSIVVVSLHTGTFANPKIPDQYEMTGITEMWMENRADPTSWTIELDGEWCVPESERSNFPCSISLKNSGTHLALMNRGGEKLSSGVYCCRLSIRGHTPLTRQITMP